MKHHVLKDTNSAERFEALANNLQPNKDYHNCAAVSSSSVCPLHEKLSGDLVPSQSKGMSKHEFIQASSNAQSTSCVKSVKSTRMMPERVPRFCTLSTAKLLFVERLLFCNGTQHCRSCKNFQHPSLSHACAGPVTWAPKQPHSLRMFMQSTSLLAAHQLQPQVIKNEILPKKQALGDPHPVQTHKQATHYLSHPFSGHIAPPSVSFSSSSLLLFVFSGHQT